MKRDPAVEKYLDDALTWEADRVQRAERSARVAWWIAGSASVLAALGLIAVVMLTPLKTSEPYVIRVDNATGITDVVPVYAGKAEISEVVTRYLLTTYVSARERYYYATAEVDYNTVGAMNSPLLNQAMMQAWDRSNPNSPLVLYKDGTTVRAQVKAITFLTRGNGDKDLAQVRFLTAKKVGGTGAEVFSHWIVTIQYMYVPPSQDEKQRALNPLGLRIVEYRREPEMVLDQPPPAEGTKS